MQVVTTGAEAAAVVVVRISRHLQAEPAERPRQSIRCPGILVVAE
jgi:hypothetical protein